MRRALLVGGALLATLWWPACTRVAVSADDEAGVGGRDGGGLVDAASPDGGLAPCELAEQQGCASPDAQFRVELRAEGGLRFVALGGIGTLLAERALPGGGSTPVVLLREGPEDWGEIGLSSAGEPVTALGIMSLDAWVGSGGELQGDGHFGFTAINLGCGIGGCRLYGMELGTSEPFLLTEIPGGELPAGAVSRGLMRRSWSPAGEAEVCAFGEGLWCFDGTGWRELTSGQDEPHVNDVTELTDGRLLAVGDAGGVWRWEGTSWMTLSPVTITDDLLRVRELRAEVGFVAVGAHGTVLTGNDELWVHASIANDDAVGTARFPSFWPGELRVVLRGGCVARVGLGGEPPVIQTGSCFYASALPGPVLDFDSYDEVDFDYWRALTADRYLIEVIPYWD